MVYLSKKGLINAARDRNFWQLLGFILIDVHFTLLKFCQKKYLESDQTKTSLSSSHPLRLIRLSLISSESLNPFHVTKDIEPLSFLRKRMDKCSCSDEN